MRPCGVFDTKYGQSTSVVRTKTQWGLLLGLLVLLFIAPLFLPNYVRSVFNTMAIIVIAVLGLQLLLGYCGQISLGQAAFMAVGAYSYSLLILKAGIPWLVAIPISALITTVIGTIFGMPSLKVKGFYLAIVTLAAQYIIVWFITNTHEFTGGTAGLQVPSAKIGGFAFNSEFRMWYLIMPITVIMTFLAKNLTRMRVGRAFIAVRDNDIAAEVMGVNIFAYKLLAFGVCAFFAGIAGSLWALHAFVISYEHFSLGNSIWYLAIIIVGGMGSITGAIIGTVFLEGLREGLQALIPVLVGMFPALALKASMWGAIQSAIFGLVITVFLIFEPRGLYHRWQIFKSSYRLWPFPY